jgi:hypothetical protein
LSGKVKIVIGILIVLMFLIAVTVITQPRPEHVTTQEDRIAAIPQNATKMSPTTDAFKPVVHSSQWKQPVPLPGPVNTAGAEDSPFITQNGSWFFFFFTPDVNVPVEKQLIDGMTGIWWTQKVGDNWTSPEKIDLSNDVSLEGAQCVVGTTMWFASVRAGNLGEIDVYSAEYKKGKWTDVENLGEQLNVEYDIGEFHLMADMSTLYFHTGKYDVGGSMDLWVTHKTGTSWDTPTPLTELNTAANEGFPFVTPDESELWFTSQSKFGFTGPAIFRSIKQANGSWGAPEEIISNFAGEPTLDSAGNIYFVHHFYPASGGMIEADIYVAYKQ